MCIRDRASGCTVVVRPSGTEPKIKTYFTTKGKDLAEAEADVYKRQVQRCGIHGHRRRGLGHKRVQRHQKQNRQRDPQATEPLRAVVFLQPGHRTVLERLAVEMCIRDRSRCTRWARS